MRFLIAGLGNIGQRHLRNLRSIRPDATIALLRHDKISMADEMPAGVDAQFCSVDEAIAFKPQAAILSNPSATHVATASALAEAGAHLLIEKPLSDRTAGVPELIESCRSRGLTLMVGYTLRFMTSLQEVRRVLKSGAIGSLVYARAEVGQYLPDWRPNSDYRTAVTARRALGGGVLLELSHELDYLLWMIGMPVRVSARGGRYSDLETDVEDLVEIVLEFDDPNRMASVHLDMIQRSPVRACRLVGESGTIVWDGIGDTLDVFTVETRAWERRPGIGSRDRNSMYIDELRHFVGCIEHGRAPEIDGEQALAVLRVVEAARESMATSRMVTVST